MTRFDELKYRILVCEMLSYLNKERNIPFRELASEMNVQATSLNRYAKGHVLPSLERCKQIHEKIIGKRFKLENEIMKYIKSSDGHVSFDDELFLARNYAVIYEAIPLDFLSRFLGKHITKLVTIEGGGIPYASILANKLERGLVKIRKNGRKGDIIGEYGSKTLYLSKGLLRKRDSIVLIDNDIRTGETLNASLDAINRTKAEVSGIYVLAELSNEWKNKVKPPEGCKVEIVCKYF